MLYEFKLGNEQIYKQIRIWIDEYPCVNNNKEFEIGNQIITRREKLDNNRNVACEVCLPKNASNYALLGCTYNNIDYSFANIKVCYSKEHDKIYESALNSQYYDKYICMEEEYIEGINLGANIFNDKKIIAKGEYLFDLQVICEVGSSISIFSKTAQVLLEIIHLKTLNEDSILKIIKKYL